MIDLVSDTKSRPSEGMRRAMAEAVVGDEQYDEDPTTLELCARVAGLLGKPAAVFLPSGTMCNQIAIRVHCEPGDELIASLTSHIVRSEAGGAAAVSGVTTRTLEGDQGRFSAEQVKAAIRGSSRYAPRTRLVCVEQSAAFPSGSVWSLAELAAVADVAERHGLRLHMDGARVANAAVALGVSMADVCHRADSVWLDLSKGLGAPIGAVLAGDEAFIARAWRFKQQWGGAMRQSGIVAAAGIYALKRNLDRLAQDHANAAVLAAGLADIDGIAPAPVTTNIVYFDVSGTGVSAADFIARLKTRGVLMGAAGPSLIRAVTHLDVDDTMVRTAVACVRDAAK